MSRDQIAGQNYDIQSDNKFSESVKPFEYFGTTVKNQNSVQEEIKSRLSQAVLAIIQCRIFCLPVCYPKI
jgi:hypothetical protein